MSPYGILSRPLTSLTTFESVFLHLNYKNVKDTLLLFRSIESFLEQFYPVLHAVLVFNRQFLHVCTSVKEAQLNTVHFIQ